MEIPNRNFFQVPGTFSPASCYMGGKLHEAGIFLDEFGSDGMKDRYYLLTLVIHDQNDDISRDISLYKDSLRAKELPDIPFHASPLLNGHGSYEGLDLATDEKFFGSWRQFKKRYQERNGQKGPRRLIAVAGRPANGMQVARLRSLRSLRSR